MLSRQAEMSLQRFLDYLLCLTQGEKTPGSFSGADTMTLFIFVEDTPMSSQSPTTSGSYDDA